jgi:hypothetical protein
MVVSVWFSIGEQLDDLNNEVPYLYFLNSSIIMPERNLDLHGAIISIAEVVAGDTINTLKNEGLNNGVNSAAYDRLSTAIASIDEVLRSRFSNFTITGTDLII